MLARSLVLAALTLIPDLIFDFMVQSTALWTTVKCDLILAGSLCRIHGRIGLLDNHIGVGFVS